MSTTRFEFTHRARPILEVGIGSTVLDTSAGVWDVSLWDAPDATWNGDEPLWRDVSCDIIEAHTNQGRGRMSDPFPVGDAEVIVDNHSGWADPDDDFELDSTVGYLSFPGDADNYVEVDHYAALNITGDISLMFRFRSAQWPPPAYTGAIAGVDDAWLMLLQSNECFQFWSVDGGLPGLNIIQSLPITPSNEWRWFYFALDVNNGAGGHNWKWWYGGNGDNPQAWVEYDSGTAAGVLAIDVSTEPLIIGSQVDGGFRGDISHLSIRSGFGTGLTVGGTVVFEFNGWDLRDSDVPALSHATELFDEDPDGSGLYEELGEPSEFVETPPGSGLYEWVGP